MRSLALVALLGSSVVSTHLVGQSLTEHAAAAAGATIGTAAGKPLGTALGNIFGSVDKSTSKAATTNKTVKPANTTVTKPEPVAPVATVGVAPSGGVSIAAGGGGESSAGSTSGGGSHHSARHREASAEAEPAISAPIVPVIAEPVVKEPTVGEVASLKVGATAGEMRALLGAPESSVSIPDDDGHLVETCQYWANGVQIGTIRLDNGRVVSVQTAN